MMRRIGAIFLLAALEVSRLASAETAPPLQLPTLAGPVFDLEAQRGHVVIVNFWATWCVPCRAEMPILDAFYHRHQGDGLAMIGVSVDTPHDLPAVKKIAGSVSYPIGVARDAGKNGFPAANALPVTYIIDAQGSIRARLTPEAEGLTERQLAAVIDPLLRAARP